MERRQICDPQHHLLVLGRCIYRRVSNRRAAHGRILRALGSAGNLTGWIGRDHALARYLVAVVR